MSFFGIDPTLIMGSASLGAVLIGLYVVIKKTRPRREVMYLRERDRRGQRLSITAETATAASCRARKGIDKRFFKYAGSYTFNEGGMVTRFFSKEGTAYTYKPQEHLQTKAEVKPRDNSTPPTKTQFADVVCPECASEFEYPVNVSVPSVSGLQGDFLGGFKEALVTVWGKEFYNEIPEKERKIVENSKIFVTVELEPGLTPEGYSPVSEEDINEEQDRNASRIFAKSLQQSTRSELYKGMLWASVGALITFIAFAWGIFKI